MRGLLAVVALTSFVVGGCGAADPNAAATGDGAAGSSQLCLDLEEATARGRAVEERQAQVWTQPDPDPGTVQGYIDALRDMAAALGSVATHLDERHHAPLVAAIDTHTAAADLIEAAQPGQFDDDDFRERWTSVMDDHVRDESEMAALDELLEVLTSACPDADLNMPHPLPHWS